MKTHFSTEKKRKAKISSFALVKKQRKRKKKKFINAKQMENFFNKAHFSFTRRKQAKNIYIKAAAEQEGKRIKI
jgi:hypothetical protein